MKAIKLLVLTIFIVQCGQKDDTEGLVASIVGNAPGKKIIEVLSKESYDPNVLVEGKPLIFTLYQSSILDEHVLPTSKHPKLTGASVRQNLEAFMKEIKPRSNRRWAAFVVSLIGREKTLENVMETSDGYIIFDYSPDDVRINIIAVNENGRKKLSEYVASNFKIELKEISPEYENEELIISFIQEGIRAEYLPYNVRIYENPLNADLRSGKSDHQFWEDLQLLDARNLKGQEFELNLDESDFGISTNFGFSAEDILVRVNHLFEENFKSSFAELNSLIENNNSIPIDYFSNTSNLRLDQPHEMLLNKLGETDNVLICNVSATPTLNQDMTLMFIGTFSKESGMAIQMLEYDAITSEESSTVRKLTSLAENHQKFEIETKYFSMEEDEEGFERRTKSFDRLQQVAYEITDLGEISLTKEHEIIRKALLGGNDSFEIWSTETIVAGNPENTLYHVSSFDVDEGKLVSQIEVYYSQDPSEETRIKDENDQYTVFSVIYISYKTDENGDVTDDMEEVSSKVERYILSSEGLIEVSSI